MLLAGKEIGKDEYGSFEEMDRDFRQQNLELRKIDPSLADYWLDRWNRLKVNRLNAESKTEQLGAHYGNNSHQG